MEGCKSNSSMNSDERTIADEESSGWTAYFEDYSNHRKEDSFCSGFGTSSMVSDAASYPAWKSPSPHHNHNHVLASSFSPNVPNKLIFKKEKARKFSQHDESLEDTASSPVNSPKVSDFLPTDMNHSKTNDHFSSSLGKGGDLQHYGGVVETDDERCEMSCSSGNKDCTDLKKRGLCLVPLSMLVNYLG
ncbi:vascular-related unknown protein 1 [Manihot esculenta]|uniref:Uncharacterized protein n=2 Tax=Manihot esculenta TaxID=3983 RepID=A0ACB7GK85_MANES|nr:vascular-related unknown protein 1 [Manihot esculenta]KAG8640645.1 hypothetical protein MANES_13G071601v8 [Manihot esculenta]